MSKGINLGPSPRLRRASRPLSKIHENPDDSTMASNSDTTTNSLDTVRIHNDDLSRSSPSQLTRSTTPTRRKAVAPLQHPVTVLLDGHSNHSNLTRIKPAPDLDIVQQNILNCTDKTPAVPSIIKWFSSLENKNNTGCKSTPDHLSSISENSSYKNSLDEKMSTISKSQHRYDKKTKPPLHCRTIKDKIRTLGHKNDITNTNYHSCNHSETETECCLCSKQGDELERIDKDANGNSDSTENSNVYCDVNINSKYNKDYDGCNGTNIDIAGLNSYPLPLQCVNCTQDSMLPPITKEQSNENSTIMNYEDHILDSSNTSLNHVINLPNPKYNNLNKSNQVFSNLISNPSSPASSSLKINHHVETPMCRPLKPDEETLDTDTLEWKKRVRRSVSFIKVSNPLEISSKTRRRVSSFQLSNHTPSKSVHWKNGRKILSISNSNNKNYNKNKNVNDDNNNSSNNNYNNNNNNNNNNCKNNSTNDRDDSSNSDENTSQIMTREEQGSIKGRENQNEASEPIRRISSIDQSDFSLLKVTATRLNLPTRRPSVMAWKEKYLNKERGLSEINQTSGMERHTPDFTNTKSLDPGSGNEIDNKNTKKNDWDLTEEMKNRIDGNIAWLRKELIAIRLQDQSLARQFLNLRQAMNAFRLAVECEGHEELIADAEEDMEEIRELSELVDLPPEVFSPLSPLKQVGITKMNISCRRFSTC